MEPLMLLDFILAVLIVVACIKGYQRGLILAVFSMIAWIVGLAAALKLSAVIADHMKGSISVSAKWLPFLSFILVFFVVVFLVRWGGKLIQKSFQVILLGWINRLGGVLFYAALYLIIYSIFLFYAEKLQVVQPSVIHSSQTYPFIQPWGPRVIDGFGNLIPVFKDMFSQLEEFFSGLSNKIPH